MLESRTRSRVGLIGWVDHFVAIVYRIVLSGVRARCEICWILIILNIHNAFSEFSTGEAPPVPGSQTCSMELYSGMNS